MDPITNLLVQLGVGGGALAVLRWFAGRVLDLFERRVDGMADAVHRIEPKVNDIHAKICPPRPCLYDSDPEDAA